MIGLTPAYSKARTYPILSKTICRKRFILIFQIISMKMMYLSPRINNQRHSRISLRFNMSRAVRYKRVDLWASICPILWSCKKVKISLFNQTLLFLSIIPLLHKRSKKILKRYTFSMVINATCVEYSR